MQKYVRFRWFGGIIMSTSCLGRTYVAQAAEKMLL